jgi:KUP system potassium uptake protein
MTLAALGIVYGDIGTSPLYALKQAAGASGTLSPDTLLGIASLIFWSLIVVITLKYAVLILRADNRGEGGIMAMLALLDARNAPRRSRRASLLIVGLAGAALLYGDGVITPAISVLSAIEGLKVEAPQLSYVIVPLTLAILIALFLVQRRGTGFIGSIFGPVMLGWFLVLALLGAIGIARAPGVLVAAEPAVRLELPEPRRIRDQLRGAGRCLSGRHRRRGDVRRHGPFRAAADPPRLVHRRAAVLGAQLFWTSGAAAD